MKSFLVGICIAVVALGVGRLAFGVEPTLGEVVTISIACAAIRFVNDVFFEA
jgi:hypothetical protein